MEYDRLLAIERVRERALRMPTEKPRPDSEMALRPREYEKILREALGEPIPDTSSAVRGTTLVILILFHLFL